MDNFLSARVHPCIWDRNAFNRLQQCSFLLGNFSFIASNLHRGAAWIHSLDLGCFGDSFSVGKAITICRRSLTTISLSRFKHWQVEMEVGVGRVNKGLCLPSPWKDRDLSVMISWVSGDIPFLQHFKLLTKMRTQVFFVISEFCYIKNIETKTLRDQSPSLEVLPSHGKNLVRL